MNRENFQSYINNFRRRIAPHLKPGIGIFCHVYPSEDGGAILEFTIGLNVENDDIYKEISKSLGSALSNIKQRAFGGNLEGFAFRGTNTILEDNRIIFIKESSPNEWSDSAAGRDVSELLPKSGRRAR